MPSCVVKCCKNNTTIKNKTLGITYHTFPIQCTWRNKWMEVIRESRNDESWLPSKCSVVCSMHFNDMELYTTKHGLRRVIKFAIPSKMLDVHVKNEDLDQISVSTDNLDLHTPVADHQTIVDPIASYGNVAALCTTVMSENTESSQVTIRTSPVQEDLSPWDNNDSDLESIFDTPERSALRNQIKRKTKMLNISRSKIKTLNQKVRRLQKKNQHLRNSIKEFKSKKIMSGVHENNVPTE